MWARLPSCIGCGEGDHFYVGALDFSDAYSTEPIGKEQSPRVGSALSVSQIMLNHRLCRLLPAEMRQSTV
jgi:hypothetical protein